MQGHFVVGHCKYFVAELHHLIEVDDDPHQEDHEEGRGEQVVLFCKEPEKDTEDKKDIEGLDDFEEEKLQNGGLFDDHRAGTVGVLEMVGLCLCQALLNFSFLCEALELLLEVVDQQSHCLVLVHDVGHVAVGETYSLLFYLLAD